MKKTKTKNPIVAVAQIRYFGSPEKHNLAQIKKYITRAGKAKADIICFPESCVHKTDFLKLEDGLIKEIQQSCAENNIWAIITDSFIKKKVNYKISLLINRQGKIKGEYKKINLYHDNDTVAGDKIFVYQTDFAKIGIAICWDLAFPKLFSQMKKAGAEIVFCPSKWCYENSAHKKDHQQRELNLLKSLILSRAFENLFFMVYASPLTKQKDLISYSAIAGPHHILKEIQNKEGLILERLNLKELQKFSRLYPSK